jgi:hypothetical protein
VQAVNFFAQRGVLYFVHQAPPERRSLRTDERKSRSFENTYI